MFERILVALQNPPHHEEISHAALWLAWENRARLRWVQCLSEKDPSDNHLLCLLHDQSMRWNLQSDTAQFRGAFSSILREQILRWSPDLVVVEKKHLPELMPLFLDLGNIGIHQFQPNQSWIGLTIPAQADLIMHQQFVNPTVAAGLALSHTA